MSRDSSITTTTSNPASIADMDHEQDHEQDREPSLGLLPESVTMLLSSSLSSSASSGTLDNDCTEAESLDPPGSYSSAVASIEAADKSDPHPIVIRLRPADLARIEDYIHNTADVSRFCYDFQAEECHLEMAETADLALRLEGTAAAARLRRVRPFGTITITFPNIWTAQPDFSFRELGACFPAIVAEIAFAQSTKSVEGKARKWLEHAVVVAGSRTRAVLIIDIAYPKADKATVSLLVTDNKTGNSSWAIHRQTIFDDANHIQPSGSVALFASDFLGSLDGLPSEIIRQSPAQQQLPMVPGHAHTSISLEDLRLALYDVFSVTRDVEEAQAPLAQAKQE
ncbi:hypothetical protein EsH8_XV_000003 [Colletotrichum jinshuiense]